MKTLTLTFRPLLLALFFLPALLADSTRLTVQVTSADTGKPIDRASVVIKFRHGRNVNLRKIVTNWETKTNQQGRVSIPAIPNGEVTIMVIAGDFQTFGNNFDLNQPEQTVEIKLNRPQPQYSEQAQHK